MKKIASFLSGVSLAAFATTAMAGGPVMVPDEGEPVVIATETSSSRPGIVIPLLLLLVVGAALAGGDDDDTESGE